MSKGKRRMPIRQNPGRQGMKPLPGFEDLVETPESKAENFVSKLMDNGFIGQNELYFKNYLNADVGVALNHIKNGYINYVLNGGWTEEKFETVINEIIRQQNMLIPSSFVRVGMDFDLGKIQATIKTSYSEMSDEDILEALRKNY